MGSIYRAEPDPSFKSSLAREEMEELETYSGGLQFAEATEYVKQQLSSMGVKTVTERELEAYTQDFLQLLKEKEEKEHLEEESITSDEETDSTAVPLSAAVFKTVLHNNDSTQIQPAAAVSSPTPSLNTSFERHCGAPEKPVLQVTVRNNGDRVIKRKILRHCDPASYSADNSAISDLNSSYRSLADSGMLSHRSTTKPPKSFIRPTTDLPHNIKGTYIKKCDPVQRFHEYNECWKVMKPPGEQPRHGLRWHIREQLLQDNPVIVAPPPAPPVRKPSNYVVPTSKKRQNLRWAIRHKLAQK